MVQTQPYLTTQKLTCVFLATSSWATVSSALLSLWAVWHALAIHTTMEQPASPALPVALHAIPLAAQVVLVAWLSLVNSAFVEQTAKHVRHLHSTACFAYLIVQELWQVVLNAYLAMRLLMVSHVFLALMAVQLAQVEAFAQVATILLF